MALYVRGQDLYRSTILGHSLRAALDDFLSEVQQPQRDGDSDGGGDNSGDGGGSSGAGGGASSGAGGGAGAAGATAAAASGTNSAAAAAVGPGASPAVTEGGDAHPTGPAAAAPSPSAAAAASLDPPLNPPAATSIGPDTELLVEEVMYELEKATAVAFSNLEGEDSGEQNEGCQLHGDIRSYTHRDNTWRIAVRNAQLRQGSGVVERLGDLKLVAMELPREPRGAGGRKRRGTRGRQKSSSTWTKTPSRFRMRQ